MVGTSDPTVREFVPVSDWSDEETRDPLHADDRNFYKVEQWSRDGMRVERLLYAGNKSRHGGGHLRPRHQASPTHQIDHSPAGARAATALNLKSMEGDGGNVRHLIGCFVATIRSPCQHAPIMPGAP
jgi:hypothetical protein